MDSATNGACERCAAALARNAFLCPGHDARFSPNDISMGGERTSSLRSYPPTYDAVAGTITVG
jgi:hypothetical protein